LTYPYVRVTPDNFGRTLTIEIVLSDVLIIGAGNITYTVHPGDGLPDGYAPINLPYEVGVALYTELGRSLGLVTPADRGVPEQVYWKSEERVDKLINTLISLALDRMDDAVS
jgi:hypothetical protein